MLLNTEGNTHPPRSLLCDERSVYRTWQAVYTVQKKIKVKLYLRFPQGEAFFEPLAVSFARSSSTCNHTTTQHGCAKSNVSGCCQHTQTQH